MGTCHSDLSVLPEDEPTLHERFWSKVDVSDDPEGCWEWTASKTIYGYGQFWLVGQRKIMASHRASFEWANGAIPPRTQIDHICHNPACVRPGHLRLATDGENKQNKGLQSNNKSGYRGVAWHKDGGKWQAYVWHNKRKHSLGLFTDVHEAGEVARKKRLELFTHNDLDRSTA